MPTPWWLDDANVEAEQSLWDTFVMNTVVMPGLARIEVTQGASRKVDKRRGRGRNGWRLVEQGPEPVEFTVTLRLWEQAHWELWERYSQTISRRMRDGSLRTAIPVAHPALAALNVLTAYMTEIGGVKPESDASPAVWSVQMKFIEYRQPTASNATRTVQPPWFNPTASVSDQRPAPRNPFLSVPPSPSTGPSPRPGINMRP